MIKREANFQTVFNKYLKDADIVGHFELKKTTKNRIPFKCVKEHQIEGLIAAAESGFVWKYSDQDQREKPFDCSSMPPMSGYIVIKFPGAFYLIDVLDFVFERDHSIDKSLTKARAEVICTKYVKL